MSVTRTTRRAFVLLAATAGATPGLGQARQRLLLLTGAAGGAFHEYGPILARIAAAYSPIDIDVQVTGGSNENIRSVARGDADFGLINMGPAFDAWNGKPPFEGGDAYRNLRALFPMYETPFSLLALKASGVTGVSGLEGKTVGVGPAGGPGQVFFEGFSKALGLKTKIATGSPSDLGRRVLAGEVDAFWYGAGVPVAAFVEVLDRADAVVFGLTEAEVAALRGAFAYFAPYEIAPGSYKGQAAPIRTAAVWNFVVGSDRMSDEAAYGLTKAALDHTAEMAAAFPSAAGTAISNVGANTFMPFHPGAARFHREKGLTLAPALLLP